jgi:uncharacterized protein (TIGR00369 family)
MSDNQPLMSIEAMNARIHRSPFNRWLGLEAIAATATDVVIRVNWREEMGGSPDTGAAHGGVLAAIVDATASYTVAAAIGRIGPTLDMRVDFHKSAKPGNITATGRLIKMGRSIASVDVTLCDVDGKLISSGRVVFFVQQNS